MGYIDRFVEDDDLLLTDDEFDRVQEKRTKERTKRLSEEGQRYAFDERKSSWTTTIIWENEVMKGRNLLPYLVALDMISTYCDSDSIDDPLIELCQKYDYLNEDQLKAVYNILTSYFVKGEELSKKIQEQFNKGIAF